MVTIRIKLDLPKIKRYLRENWGVPFVILFQTLLLLGGGLLIQGSSALANTIVTYSYYSLLIGIILQLISSAFDRRRKQKNE